MDAWEPTRRLQRLRRFRNFTVGICLALLVITWRMWHHPSRLALLSLFWAFLGLLAVFCMKIWFDPELELAKSIDRHKKEIDRGGGVMMSPAELGERLKSRK